MKKFRSFLTLFVAAAAFGLGFVGHAEAAPLSERKCAALRDGLEQRIDITPAFEMWREETEVPPLGQRAICRLAFRDTGVVFERPDRRGFLDAVSAMRAALEDEGWFETPAQSPFAADAALATRFAVSKGRDVCIVNISFTLAEGDAVTERLAGDPAAILALEPAERLYTIRLACLSPS